ncbi:uncharacterized protein LOC135144329 [Zophobas morio]|uniref:uncharacterized protein LOC135144329 n=1 Tax=Zophobas morio TaxID=2755281 RepID=UPI0030827D8F
MERLANMELYQSEASRMDLSTALVNKTTVRTTLSAALSVANFLGIKIAVTGSLNGVQRNANSEGTYAISSSIPEIGRNSVSVVCSGLGPTVHLDKTMQFLTTASVTTATYGNTKDLPVFGCFNSGGRALSTMHSTSITDIAQLVLAHMDLGLKGLVIFVPASPPNALEFSTIEEALRQALTEAESEKFTFTEGNQFLCARVFEIVDFPESFIRDLYVSSAIKGSEIAMELWKIKGSSHL